MREPKPFPGAPSASAPPPLSPAPRQPGLRRHRAVSGARGGPDPELLHLVAVADRAAAIVLSYFGGPLAVELKGPADPVTRADREANDAITASLAERYPEAGVVAEESAPRPGPELASQTDRPRVFFVDPLDGTREFVAGRPEFAVMIGLTEQGHPAAGVVALPAEGLVLAARVGAGAWQRQQDGAWTALAIQEPPQGAEVRVLVSRSKPPELDDRLTRRWGAYRAVPCGSVGVKAARLLQGAADAYLHRGGGLKLWDYCAPEAVLLAAGARVTDWAGRGVGYATGVLEQARGLLAASPRLHRRMLPPLRESLKDSAR